MFIDEITILNLINSKKNKSFYSLSEARNYFNDQDLYYFHSDIDIHFNYKIISEFLNKSLKSEYKFENYFELYEKYDFLTSNLLYGITFFNPKDCNSLIAYFLDKTLFLNSKHVLLDTSAEDKMKFYLQNKKNIETNEIVEIYNKIIMDRYNKFFLTKYLNLNCIFIQNTLKIDLSEISNIDLKQLKLYFKNNDFSN